MALTLHIKTTMKHIEDNLFDLYNTLQNFFAGERVLNFKERILLCIESGENTPKEIMMRTGLVKSNLAAICRGLINSGLINKIKADALEGRKIKYVLTQKGVNNINKLKQLVIKHFESVDNQTQLCESIQKIIKVLK